MSDLTPERMLCRVRHLDGMRWDGALQVVEHREQCWAAYAVEWSRRDRRTGVEVARVRLATIRTCDGDGLTAYRCAESVFYGLEVVDVMRAIEAHGGAA